MLRFPPLISIAVAASVCGCATAPGSTPLDASNSAQLEFVKGHPKSNLWHAGIETFSICTPPTCSHRHSFVALAWTTPDSVTRQVPAGETAISAAGDDAVANYHSRCHGGVSFRVEAGHVYMVKLAIVYGAPTCQLSVRDKVSGEYQKLTDIPGL